MNFVNWPTDWDIWSNTGEGGLFAYAVWPTVDGDCSIDVYPQMPMGDVLVSAHGSLKDDFAVQNREFNHLLRERPEESYSGASFDVQVATSAAVYLGSTRSSSWDGRDYFNVTAVSLTAEGRTVVDALTAAYGTEPTFLTYLDT